MQEHFLPTLYTLCEKQMIDFKLSHYTRHKRSFFLRNRILISTYPTIDAY